MITLEQQDWGRTEGKAVKLFTLDNGKGLCAKICSYGGIITELHVPGRHGQPGNVVLGFATLDEYLKGHPFFGAIAGRVANRIAGAHFCLDGQEYSLPANNRSEEHTSELQSRFGISYAV